MFLYFRNVSWPCNQQRQNYFQFSDQNCNRLRFLFVSKRFFPELSCRSFSISTFHCIETSQTLPCQTLPLNKVKSGQYIYISFPILAIVSIILQGTTNCTVPVFSSNTNLKILSIIHHWRVQRECQSTNYSNKAKYKSSYLEDELIDNREIKEIFRLSIIKEGLKSLEKIRRIMIICSV